MNKQKENTSRERLNDILALAGTVLIGAGLYTFDIRLVLVFAGIVCYIVLYTRIKGATT